MIELTKRAIDGAEIDFEKLISALKSAVLSEAAVIELYAVAYTWIDDHELSEALFKARADHVRHHDRLLTSIRNLGGKMGYGLLPQFQNLLTRGEIADLNYGPGVRSVPTNAKAMIIEEQELLKTYDTISQLNAGKTAAINELLAPIVHEELEHKRFFQRFLRASVNTQKRPCKIT